MSGIVGGSDDPIGRIVSELNLVGVWRGEARQIVPGIPNELDLVAIGIAHADQRTVNWPLGVIRVGKTIERSVVKRHIPVIDVPANLGFFEDCWRRATVLTYEVRVTGALGDATVMNLAAIAEGEFHVGVGKPVAEGKD